MAQPHEHALACPVGAENDRARPGRNLDRDAVDNRPAVGNEEDLI